MINYYLNLFQLWWLRPRKIVAFTFFCCLFTISTLKSVKQPIWKSES